MLMDSRHKYSALHPPMLPDILCATQIKILEVTVTSHLYVIKPL